MAEPYEIILKLLLGTLLGGIIGFERQTHGRAAGFRTQLLVCVACVLLMIISENYYVKGSLTPQFMRIDPTRIAAGAMTGVGFLGAGVILKTGLSIQGLTTAACIWIVSAIGLAIGAGQYLAGISGFAITFFSLWGLRIMEVRMPRLIYRYVTIITDDSGDERTVTLPFLKKGFRIVRMDYAMAPREKEKTFIFTVTTRDPASIKEVVDEVVGLTVTKRIEVKS
ncbi:MAG TPA: MgtC/SapB family protein [Candidatus Sulfobium mesophilum]|jgi:putative Mg2+ transporter-C (MgtC) family protein|uniref:Putative MgtC/SapB transporter n=1 Tax=Candidatus Sulfobium mesophilum TaxID=2016548 RepID=A0A2U3QHB0_9BACT|nr:putative MgtC/SapB transporter [Candidatus Sulfobium mesophilum]HSB31750.1 MgtC/SapB family protein [Candidatus Sulfobium mesophilum]